MQRAAAGVESKCADRHADTAAASLRP